jgi:hypothetical protein
MLNEEDGGEFDPHLSLIYKTMPNQSKAQLARSLQLPFERVSFDRIKAVRTPAKIQTAEDVHAWRSLWERLLVL